jgi:syntenin-1
MYPSLEDMKVGHMMQAQTAPLPNDPKVSYPFAAPPAYPNQGPEYKGHGAASAPMAHDQNLQSAYPALFDMGLNLSPDEVNLIMGDAVAVQAPGHVQTSAQANPAYGALVAPVSGSSLGLQRAHVTHGIREVTLCKSATGKVGFRVQAVSKGVFVVFVQKDSPAAMVGLRFGDQILQIDGENVAGYSVEKVHSIIKKGPANGVRVAVRDRPFERTVTLHKDSVGHIGFSYKNGRITAIVKDSSAARNGLLIDHNILEVNGQNIVGMEDKLSRKIIEEGGDVITVTIMPSFVYDHLVKHMASSLVKKMMDHSVPDI